jgi:hypothetical protein
LFSAGSIGRRLRAEEGRITANDAAAFLPRQVVDMIEYLAFGKNVSGTRTSVLPVFDP